MENRVIADIISADEAKLEYLASEATTTGVLTGRSHVRTMRAASEDGSRDAPMLLETRNTRNYPQTTSSHEEAGRNPLQVSEANLGLPYDLGQ